jgi:hypothetical protein
VAEGTVYGLLKPTEDNISRELAGDDEARLSAHVAIIGGGIIASWAAVVPVFGVGGLFAFSREDL